MFVEREYDMGEGWTEYHNEKSIRRNVGVVWLHFLILPLHVIGVWLGED